MLTLFAQYNTTDAGQSGEVPISRNCEKYCDADARSLFGRFARCLAVRRNGRHYSSRSDAPLAEQHRRSSRDPNKPSDLCERGRSRGGPDRDERFFGNYSERGGQLSAGPGRLHPGRDFPRRNINPRTEQSSDLPAWSRNGANDFVRLQ